MSEHVRADLRFAWRLTRRSPLSSLAVVITMILGIGATTAVFSIVNALLLQPLPFPNSDRIVRLTANIRENVGSPLAYPDLLDYRARVKSFAEVSGVAMAPMTLQQSDKPEQVRIIRTDDAYGRIFGVRPLLGRFITASDLDAGMPRVIVLNYAFWMRAFGGDRGIVGRPITLDNQSFVVVGVLPQLDFLYPENTAAGVIPLRVLPGTMFVNRGAMWIDAIAKVRPGIPFQTASVELSTVASNLASTYPKSNTDVLASLAPLQDTIVGSVKPMLVLLVLSMAAVLLVACLNVANLLLGKAQTRSREFMVRAALGGSAWRIRSQIFSEGFLLAVIGGACGLALAPVLTRALVSLYPSGLPRAPEIGVDLRVLAIAALTTILAGILSVLPLARRAGRVDLSSGLREGGRGGTSRAVIRSGNALVIVQVATSVALLFASTLLVTTFVKLSRLDAGFDPSATLTFKLSPPSASYKTAGELEQYFRTLLAGIAQIPGVDAVGSATQIPMGNASFGDVFVRKDRGDQGTANPSAYVAAVSPGFDRALGMRLRRGRSFAASDDSTAEHVVVIDEALARSAWPGEDALGKVIEWNLHDWRVIGIVAETRDQNLSAKPSPHLYAPATQRPGRTRYVVVRSKLAPAALIPPLRQTVRSMDATIAMTDIATMEQRMEAALAAQRFRALLIGAMALLTLALSVLGIYSVVAYTVGQRTREIGIRMALGESAARVRRDIVIRAMRVSTAGALGGLFLSLAVGQWLSAFLFEAAPRDPRLLFAVMATMISIAAVAAFGPAYRASNVDPVITLRSE